MKSSEHNGYIIVVSHQLIENDIDTETYNSRMERPSYWAFHVKSWLSQKNILLVSFDDILKDYESTLRRISEFTGESLARRSMDMRRSEKGLKSILRKARRRIPFLAFNDRKYTSISFRKGESGDWVNYFTEDDAAFFQRQAGDVNSSLNYCD